MSGYEKIARLMCRHPEMATFQRFDLLNTMNILFLQAELTHLQDDLRQSMEDDVQSRRPSGPAMSIRTSCQDGSQDANQSCQRKSEDGHDMASIASQESTEARARTSPISEAVSEDCDERAESGKDWYVLANMTYSPTWKIMVEIREKLKEYGAFFLVDI
jgi:hypothetical protein